MEKVGHKLSKVGRKLSKVGHTLSKVGRKLSEVENQLSEVVKEIKSKKREIESTKEEINSLAGAKHSKKKKKALALVKEEEDLRAERLALMNKEEDLRAVKLALMKEEENLRAEKLALMKEEENLRAEKQDLRVRVLCLNASLWRHGLPQQDNFANTTTYTSNHESVTVYPRDISLPDLDGFLNKDGLRIPSLSLVSLQNKPKYFHFQTEADVATRVTWLVSDVVTCLGLSASVTLSQETSLPASGGATTVKSDLWVIKASGVPISLLEVKRPKENILENRKVLGQLFDNMVAIRNSFGQCEIIGIATSFKDWRLCWLPDTDDYATSGSMLEPTSDMSSFCLFPRTRALSVSPVYNLFDPLLVRRIAFVILKSLSSRHQRVPLLSSRRAYIILEDKIWRWGSLTKNRRAQISFTLPKSAQKLRLTVLREFTRGAHGSVFLALTQSFSLVVVKKYHEIKTFEEEKFFWKEIHEVDAVEFLFLGCHCLVLPFVFHCLSSAEQEQQQQQQVFFDFDLSAWGKSSDLVDDDRRFDEWTKKFRHYAQTNPLSPKSVLDSAIKSFSEKGYAHADLAWRHVGLLPQCVDGAVVGMKPILIDLGQVTKSEKSVDGKLSPKRALKIMKQRIIAERLLDCSERDAATDASPKSRKRRVGSDESSIPNEEGVDAESRPKKKKSKRRKEEFSR